VLRTQYINPGFLCIEVRPLGLPPGLSPASESVSGVHLNQTNI